MYCNDGLWSKRLTVPFPQPDNLFHKDALNKNYFLQLFADPSQITDEHTRNNFQVYASTVTNGGILNETLVHNPQVRKNDKVTVIVDSESEG